MDDGQIIKIRQLLKSNGVYARCAAFQESDRGAYVIGWYTRICWVSGRDMHERRKPFAPSWEEHGSHTKQTKMWKSMLRDGVCGTPSVTRLRRKFVCSSLPLHATCMSRRRRMVCGTAALVQMTESTSVDTHLGPNLKCEQWKGHEL